MTTPLVRAALTTLIFVVVGPPVGALAFGIWGMVQSPPESAAIAILGLIWMLPFGYFVGILPAAVTGLIVGLVAPRHRGARVFLAASAIIGGAASMIFAAMGEGGFDPSGVFNFGWIGALAGLVAGAVAWTVAKPREAVTAPG